MPVPFKRLEDSFSSEEVGIALGQPDDNVQGHPPVFAPLRRTRRMISEHVDWNRGSNTPQRWLSQQVALDVSALPPAMQAVLNVQDRAPVIEPNPEPAVVAGAANLNRCCDCCHGSRGTVRGVLVEFQAPNGEVNK